MFSNEWIHSSAIFTTIQFVMEMIEADFPITADSVKSHALTIIDRYEQYEKSTKTLMNGDEMNTVM